MALTTVADLKTAMPGWVWPLSYAGNGAKATGAFVSCWTGTQAQTSWPLATYPGASTAWTVLDSTTTGAFPQPNATGGAKNYLTRAWGFNAFTGSIILYDRLAQTGAITPAASTQTITGGPTLTRPDANGADVECWIESITASTSTASNYSIRYVNQDGATQTSPTIAAVTTSTVGMMQRFNLAAGDTGIRSVDQFISTGASGGTAQLVLMRRIAQFPVLGTVPQITGHIHRPAPLSDWLDMGLAEIPPDACLAVMFHGANSGGNSWQGTMNIVQG